MEARIFCDPTAFGQVQAALQKNSIQVQLSEISQVPKAPVDVEPETGKKVLRIMEALDDQDDVQNVYSNVNISEELVAAAAKE